MASSTLAGLSELAKEPTSRHDRYRGRLAPSSTGWLHLGHARTFWVAAQRARAAAGTLVFRDEDLDLQRSRPAFSLAMIEDLRWLGLQWDEGPDVGGAFGPYTQSGRLEHYLAAWRVLVERRQVYPCCCSRKDLRTAAGAPHEAEQGDEDDEPIYPGSCRPADPPNGQVAGGAAAMPAGPAGVSWRFRVPDGEMISFHDGNLGACSYLAGQDFGDFVVWRRDDRPAYQLACVVDDAAMQITEVVRGADLLKSTARQLLLYRALGLQAPNWFHCPLVLDAEGRRLAKQTGQLSIRSLREAGHTPGELLRMAGLARADPDKGTIA